MFWDSVKETGLPGEISTDTIHEWTLQSDLYVLLPTQVQLEHHLPVGDFPNVHKFREIVRAYDVSKFPKLEKKHLAKFDEVLNEDIPALLKQFDSACPLFSSPLIKVYE